MPVQPFSVSVLAAITGLCASTALAIPLVRIGNPGNAADPTTGFGSVAYTYEIGATEVTNLQYTGFLNAKAASDPFNLFNIGMLTEFGGIVRVGSSGSYSYHTVGGRENNPVNYVTVSDAARFANWLHNGAGNGDTETGAYTLLAGGVTRNAGWQWAMTNENEWYKAAYHQPASLGGDIDDYWLYPTSSNEDPTLSYGNFDRLVDNTTPVGYFGTNYYGTSDMAGNVWEINENLFIRGGGFDSRYDILRSSIRIGIGPLNEGPDGGFRLVHRVPGPGTTALVAIAGLSTLRRRRC